MRWAQDADEAVRQAPEGVIALDPASAQADVEGTVLAIEAARKAGDQGTELVEQDDNGCLRPGRDPHKTAPLLPGIRENA